MDLAQTSSLSEFQQFGKCGNNAFTIRQIIVGNVQLNSHPQPSANANFPQLEFVGARCSVTLVEQVNGPMKLLVDCASPFEGKELLQALRDNGIQSPSQITHLAITHWHIDHCGQIGLFPVAIAKLITPEKVKRKGATASREFGLPEGIDLAVHVGHSCADMVVKVQLNPDKASIVVIAGDLFEFENDWNGDEPWKGVALWPDRLSLARWICWNEADWIVPGHGPAFRTTSTDGKGKTLPIQSPVFGKISFDSDPLPIVQPKAENVGGVKLHKLLSFKTVDDDLFQILLIQTSNSNILINTGGLAQREELIKALNSRDLSPSSIDFLVITRPAERFCANLDIFPRSSIFLCRDVSIPGHFFAAMDHHFLLLDADGVVSVWRDLRTDSNEECTLAVLISSAVVNFNRGKIETRIKAKFVLIAQRVDEFLLSRLGVEREEIHLIRPYHMS